ncbi:hypothetical protein GCM10027059_12710 [Myceligenerans halotolerans]
MAMWGVRVEDLRLPDPPVVVHVDRFEPSEQWWELWAARLTVHHRDRYIPGDFSEG